MDILKTKIENGGVYVFAGADPDRLSACILRLMQSGTLSWKGMKLLSVDLSNRAGSIDPEAECANAGPGDIVHLKLGRRMRPEVREWLSNDNPLYRLYHAVDQRLIILSTENPSLADFTPDKFDIRDYVSSVRFPEPDWSSEIWNGEFRQAVVFFHGIGEQGAMASVRSFASSLWRYADDREDTDGDFLLASRAIRNETTLRRLSLFTDRSASRDPRSIRPKDTDFFEYYWAHRPKGMRISDTLLWNLGLLFRRPTGQTKVLWCLTWALLVVAAFFAAAYLVHGQPVETGVDSRLVAAMGFVTPALLNLVFVGYLGDAALYFSNKPHCYESREKILRGAVRLLTRVCNSGDYDRVIVVGHSLGSVIAYDALCHLWESRIESVKVPPHPHDRRRQPRLDAVQHAADCLRKVQKDAIARPFNTDLQDRLATAKEDFRSAQAALWRDWTEQGSFWKISDFVTVGSPLAHAPLLLDHGIDERFRLGEMAFCPPKVSLGQRPAGKEFKPFKFAIGSPEGRRIMPQSCFALTRWTNLYAPVRLGLFGDFVGGPLADLFGPGIADVPVTLDLLRRYRPVASHLSYWRHEARGENAALAQLCDALDLDAATLGIPLVETPRDRR